MKPGKLLPVPIAILLALGTVALPAMAKPADQAAIWTRDEPVLNPNDVSLTRAMGGGATYMWSQPSITGPLTVTNDAPRTFHWVNTVTWSEPPKFFNEAQADTLTITSASPSREPASAIDVNANWGFVNGFNGSKPREATAVCSGGCGQSATSTIDISVPFGLAYDPSHPDKNPTLWVTVDGQTVFYVRYSRSNPSPPPPPPPPSPPAPPAPAPAAPPPPPSEPGPPAPAQNSGIYVDPLDGILHVGSISTGIASADPGALFQTIDEVSTDPTPVKDHFIQCLRDVSADFPDAGEQAKVAYVMACQIDILANLTLPDGSPVLPSISGAQAVLQQMSANGSTDADALLAGARLMYLLMQQDLSAYT